MENKIEVHDNQVSNTGKFPTKNGKGRPSSSRKPLSSMKKNGSNANLGAEDPY